jgi:hypothetical protein
MVVLIEGTSAIETAEDLHGQALLLHVEIVANEVLLVGEDD